MKKLNIKRSFPLAVVMLIVSLSLLSVASYAWYSINKEVSATGMQIQNTAPNNMLISTDASVASNWKNGIVNNVDVAGGFSPSSTFDGITFYAISSSDGIDVEGGKVDESNISTVPFVEVDRISNPLTTYYAEFALYVKAGTPSNNLTDIAMYLSEFTVSTTTNHMENCIRISITEVGRDQLISFNDDGTAYLTSDGTKAAIDLSEKTTTIYKNDSTDIKPVKGLSTGHAVLSEVDPAEEAGDDSIVTFTVDKEAASYTTLIVRIWIEGQHDNCVNDITDETISVSLKWDLVD